MSEYEEIVGVYHAEGSVLGELRYLWGKFRGTTQCSLCDITHAGLREKREFREFRSLPGVSIEMVHLDERTEEQRVASEGLTPCILGLGPDGWQVLITADQLRGFDKSVDALRMALSPFVETKCV